MNRSSKGKIRSPLICTSYSCNVIEGLRLIGLQDKVSILNLKKKYINIFRKIDWTKILQQMESLFVLPLYLSWFQIWSRQDQGLGSRYIFHRSREIQCQRRIHFTLLLSKIQNPFVIHPIIYISCFYPVTIQRWEKEQRDPFRVEGVYDTCTMSGTPEDSAPSRMYRVSGLVQTRQKDCSFQIREQPSGDLYCKRTSHKLLYSFTCPW